MGQDRNVPAGIGVTGAEAGGLEVIAQACLRKKIDVLGRNKMYIS